MKPLTKSALAITMGLVMGLASQTAMAIPDGGLFVPAPGINFLRDHSAEVAMTSTGAAIAPDTALVAGDILLGYFTIAQIDPAGVNVGSGNGAGYNTITGIFAQQIQSVVANPGSITCSGLSTCSDFTMTNVAGGINGALALAGAGILSGTGLNTSITGLGAAGSMIAFFENSSSVFTPGATQTSALNAAGSGALQILAGGGTSGSISWKATAPAILSQLGTLSPGQQGGTYSFLQNILYNSGSWGTSFGALLGGNGTVTAAFGTSPFPVIDQANFASTNPPHVPEPGSLALMGLGMVALGFMKKRLS
jgi:hypothetical protein